MHNRTIQLSILIDELDHAVDERTRPFGNFTIIKIPNSREEKSEDNNKYYAIYTGSKGWFSRFKKSGFVGEGGFGSIYLTFPIITSSFKPPRILGFDFKKNRAKINPHTKTPEIDPETQKPYQLYVTKMVDRSKLVKHDDAEELLLKETEIFGNYFRAEPYVIGMGKDAFLILEYIPGLQLTPSVIEKLNYSERIALIQELLLNINLMHHNTPRTGAAFVHKDIKPDNINLHILYNDPRNPESGIKKISAYLMDFGMARVIDEDNPNRMFQNDRHCGTIGYIAPEVFWGPANGLSGVPLDVGLKSDIYSLTPVILMILGALNPIAPHQLFWAMLRQHPTGASYQRYKVNKILPDYDFSGIFKGYASPNENIQWLVIQLLRQMQSNVYQARPNSDEVLKFFNILRLYDSVNTNQKVIKSDILDIEGEKNMYLKELNLIVGGQWLQEAKIAPVP